MEREPDAASSSPLRFLSHIAFAIVLAIVIARCLMLETIRDIGGDADAPPGPGAATSIVLDWLSFLPALLLIGRRLIEREFVLRFDVVHVIFALLSVWTLASVAWADDRFLALISATRIAGGVALFWATSQIATRAAHLRVVVGVVVGILLVNVVQGALYQNVELADLRDHFERNKSEILSSRGWREGEYIAQRFEMKLLAGEMMNFNVSANVLGSLAVMCALAAIGAGLQRVRDRDEPGFAGALFIASIGCAYILAYTGSKASWAALCLGIALLAAWYFAGDWIARHRRLAFGVALVAIAIGIVGVIAVGLTRPGLPSDSLNFRWRYWVGSWPLVLERPLTGYGWGNFADAYLRHRLPEAAEEIQDPHNFLVRWLVELGVAGLALGVAWLIAWAWRATALSPSPGTPGEGRGEGLRADDATALTLALSRRTGRGDQRLENVEPMRISRVLLACLLALVTTLACTIDLGGDGSYALLETMRRAMFLAIIAIAIGFVCVGRRESPDEPFHVDERPAPMLAAGLFVGVMMLLLQSSVDMTLFQPGPWHLTVLAMGTLLGVAVWTSNERIEAKRAMDRASHAVMAIAAVVPLLWIAAAVLIVLPILSAESAARAGDAAAQRQNSRVAWISHQKAASASPVSNFDYRLRESQSFESYQRFMATRGEAIEVPPGYTTRELLGRTIAAAPGHAMSWLTRSRYLASQSTVLPADAQQSIDDFGRGVALNPNDIDLRLEYADLLERFGRRAEATEQRRTALSLNAKLDPTEPERLEFRSPGKIEAIRARADALMPVTTQP